MITFTRRQDRLLFYENLTPILLRGGASHAHILYVLINLYSKNGDDFTEEQLEEEIRIHHEILLQEGGYKSRRNIQQEIENLVEFRGNGLITLNDFYSDLKLDHKEEKSSCRMAINRLVARGMLEKVESGRTGTYRLMKKDAEMTRFITGDNKIFPVEWPFDLNGLCHIYPKSIVVIAGSKSAGKTATLLTIATLNQRRVPVVYLNSDMGDEEYTDRMRKMGYTAQDDIKFEIYNRSSNFHDLVTAEKKIFIIDFLEVHENFYEVGKPIKQIWEKLKDGIAIIGLQMKPGATVGRGGDFSKEKARLYLALDYIVAERCTKIYIEEAKSPSAAYPDGVRGWSHKVKIINGSRFSPVDTWHG